MRTSLLRLATFVVLVFAATSRPAQGSAGRIVTGSDAGASGPHLKAFTTLSLSNAASLFAYSPTFAGGVRVATGDVNGDGAADFITGSGPGAAHVKVFSGRDLAELHSFLPYGTAFSGGVFVAAGDVNGDGFADIITGADAGTSPHVKVFSGAGGAELQSFFAYSVTFRGGVRVASGDINGDGRADIITGSGPGGPPHVKVFDSATGAEIRSFFAYSVSFTGGVFVACGDVAGDNAGDVITGADSGSIPHVKVFDGGSLAEVHSFLAYSQSFQGGVRVAAGDLDGDGHDEIVTASGSGAPPHVKVFGGVSLTETASFLAYPISFTAGIFVGAASVKSPRLNIASSRASQEIQLQWPAGSVCELQGTSSSEVTQGWTNLEVRPVESGNRLTLLLPAVQKLQFFRLKCDPEAVRP